MVVFAPQNVIMDPPFTKLDLLICRNLLIYLDQRMQKKLLPLFHYSLNRGGVLFLGSAETIGAFTELFAPLAGKTRFYRRRDTALQAQPVEFPASFFADRPDAANAATQARLPMPNLQTLAVQLLLQRFSPAAVLSNDKGDILYINGRTGKYLEPAAGKANWNIFIMAREGLRHELNNAFQKALRQKAAVTLRGVKVRTLVFIEKQIANRDGRWFLLRIMLYRTLENRVDGVVITFLDITASKILEAKLRQTQVETGKRAKKGVP